jgi:uncharacterized protein YcfL
MKKARGVVLFVLATALVSCSSNQKSVIEESVFEETAIEEVPIEENIIEEIAVAGTWIDTQDRAWVFSADGKLRYENYSFDIREYRYDVSETKLTVEIERGLQIYNISASADGKTLFLTGGRNFSGWSTAGPGWSENRLTKK